MLPCGCSVEIPDHELIQSTFPCSNPQSDAQLTHVVPAAWSILTSAYVTIQTQSETPTYANLTGILNETWTDISSSSYHFNETLEALRQQLKPPKLTSFSTEIYAPLSMILWNVLNSVLILSVMYLMFGIIKNRPLTMYASAPRQYVRGISLQDELSDLETVMMSLLWINLTLILVLVVILIILGYQFRQGRLYPVQPQEGQSIPLLEAKPSTTNLEPKCEDTPLCQDPLHFVPSTTLTRSSFNRPLLLALSPTYVVVLKVTIISFLFLILVDAETYTSVLVPVNPRFTTTQEVYVHHC